MSSITDIEQAVVGACMLEPRYAQIQAILKPDNFSCKDCRIVYRAIGELYPTAKIDFLTVTKRLEITGEIEQLKHGAYSVTSMANRVASAANIEHHALLVLQEAIVREFADMLMSWANNVEGDILKVSFLESYTAVGPNRSIDPLELADAFPRILLRLGAPQECIDEFTEFSQIVNTRIQAAKKFTVPNTILTHLVQLSYTVPDSASTSVMKNLADMISIVYTRGCTSEQRTLINQTYNQLITSYQK